MSLKHVCHPVVNKALLLRYRPVTSFPYFCLRNQKRRDKFTTATFSNITFVGPKSYDGFENTTDYINGLAEGFDKVSYAGAFDTTDSWLEGWTNFDPNQTEY